MGCSTVCVRLEMAFLAPTVAQLSTDQGLELCREATKLIVIPLSQNTLSQTQTVD